METWLAEETMAELAEGSGDCERVRTMSLAELLYHALVEWGREWEGAAAA